MAPESGGTLKDSGVCSVGGAGGGREAHQALLCSFQHCRMAQSIYLQAPGITRLDKSITSVCNLWTLA